MRMKVILLPTLLFGIFFAFTNTDAQLLSRTATDCATAINNQSAAGEDYCNAQKKCSKNDLITKFIPTECKKYGLGNITLNNWEQDEDARNVVTHFQNEGWLSDALPATESGCIDPRPYINLQDCKSTGEISLGIRKVNGVDTCCALEVSTDIKQAQKEKQRLQGCGEGYDYPIKTGSPTPYEKIDKGLNITWPASPMGTPFAGTNGIPGLIKYVYDWLISLGGLMVFITLIWAGVQYLTSAGNPTQMSGAMKRIKTSSIGLALLFGSWLILNTINPRLINLGITTEGLKEGPAPNFGFAINGSWNWNGTTCGIVCEFVEFCSEPNFGGCSDPPIKVGEGNTVEKDLDIKVKSVRFQPYKPLKDPPYVGDCSVTLYQRTLKDKGFTDGKEPLILLSPVKDIGADGFPMKSFEASDMSKYGGSYFNFQPQQ